MVFHEFDQVVLQAVSDDYQSFESVVRKLSRSSRLSAVADNERIVVEIERTLLASIANKLVAAYLLHADPPYATEVGPDRATIQRYWFCITDQGREHLRRIA